MNSFAKTITLAAAVLISAAANAQSVNGAWSGKLAVTVPKMPESTTPEMKKRVMDQIEQVKKMKFLLNLKADKTFTFDVSGGPMGKGEKGSGTWTQKGNVLTLKTLKQGNKAASNQRPLELTVSTDKKKLVAKLPEGQGQASLVFTR